MKKITYSVAITLTILIGTIVIVTSCTKKDNKAMKATRTNVKIIDESNAPEITPDIYAELGFANFELDKSREILLDFNKSELRVPYNRQKSLFKSNRNNFKSAGVGICIKIATRKSNCSQGIGFRCGFVRDCFKPKKQSTQKSSLAKLSKDRIQPVEINVNRETGELVFHFINNVDWKYLANN